MFELVACCVACVVLLFLADILGVLFSTFLLLLVRRKCNTLHVEATFENCVETNFLFLVAKLLPRFTHLIRHGADRIE